MTQRDLPVFYALLIEAGLVAFLVLALVVIAKG